MHKRAARGIHLAAAKDDFDSTTAEVLRADARQLPRTLRCWRGSAASAQRRLGRNVMMDKLLAGALSAMARVVGPHWHELMLVASILGAAIAMFFIKSSADCADEVRS